MFVVASVILLAAMLWIARVRDRARVAQVEVQVAGVLTGGARELLEYLVVPIHGTRLASDVCLDAVEGRNVQRLKNGTRIARLELPEVLEGLRILARFSRTVAAVVDTPAISPLVWRAWRLRGLSGAGYVLHQILVTSAERARLRLWVLGESFRLCVRSLRMGTIRVTRDAHAWEGVRAAIGDLATASVEAEATYERLVRSLDMIGALEDRRRERLTQASG